MPTDDRIELGPGGAVGILRRMACGLFARSDDRQRLFLALGRRFSR